MNKTLIIAILFLLFSFNASAQERTDTLYTCRYRVNITEGKKITSFDTTVRVYRYYRLDTIHISKEWRSYKTNPTDTFFVNKKYSKKINLDEYDKFLPTKFTQKQIIIEPFEISTLHFYCHTSRGLLVGTSIFYKDYKIFIAPCKMAYFYLRSSLFNFASEYDSVHRRKPLFRYDTSFVNSKTVDALSETYLFNHQHKKQWGINPRLIICSCLHRQFIFEYSPSGWFSYLSYRRKKHHIEMILLALQKHG